MPTLAYRFTGQTMLLAHGNEPPDDVAWDTYVDALVENRASQILVFTDGVGPDAKQRKRMVERVSHLEARTAVVSSALGVRGMVTALSWFGIPVKAFGPRDLEMALDHLGVSSAARTQVLREALRVRLELLDVAGLVDAMTDDAVRDALPFSFEELAVRHRA